jgi:hypothetical protein
LDFFKSGVTRACLKEDGNEPSVRQRLRSVVIGGRRASIQDLINQVGRTSSEQVELLEERINFLTSSLVAGKKQFKGGGGDGGKM